MGSEIRGPDAAGQQAGQRKPAQRKLLTDKFLQALKPAPAGERLTVWDASVQGFGIRYSDKAKDGKAANIVFIAMRRRKGASTPTRVTIGRYHPTLLSLKDARAKAGEIVEALEAGRDLRREAQQARRAEDERQANTFQILADKFCAELVAGLIPKARGEGAFRDPEAVVAAVQRELVPVWKSRPIDEIKKRDVTDLIVAIHKRAVKPAGPGKRRESGGPHAARHAFNAARRLFDWTVERGVLEDSPCEGIKGKRVHGSTGARDRVLADDELRRVWQAAEATPYPYGPLIQMLILTGQRRDEIGEARWSEVDLDAQVLTIPAERMKAGVAHTVPLTPQAIAILKSLPRFSGDFIFSTMGGVRPFSGHSKAKARLDRTVGPIAPYQVHDLRRTARTGMAQAGVSVFIGELVISHRQAGVHRVYDLHGYDHEKRKALETWEARLRSIIDPPPANVVPLNQAAG
jgi:integrase